MDDEKLRIGDLARLTGTKVVTIRYYEDIGLMPPAARSTANYRVYGCPQLARLRFIRRCRALGFSLDQIRELVALSSDEGRPCADVDALTRRHLGEIEKKIADLTALAAELRRINACCDGGTFMSDCRILDALGGELDPRRA